jgi:thioester reductase-like protein
MVDNQYISSKLMSERIVLEAVAERGADAKVIRVGTLAPRESDGEFQINFLTNSAMGKLRSYALIRCFPYSQMNNMLRLGPIDESARSFMHLAKTPKECCLFHAINNHLIPIMDVIRVMKDIGIDIEIVEDAVFLRAMEEAEKDPKKAAIFSSILAYKGMVEAEAVEVEPDCEYTSQILARTGFFWNETDTEYIRKYILGMAGLKFFDEDNLFR